MISSAVSSSRQNGVVWFAVPPSGKDEESDPGVAHFGGQVEGAVSVGNDLFHARAYFQFPDFGPLVRIRPAQS